MIEESPPPTPEQEAQAAAARARVEQAFQRLQVMHLDWMRREKLSPPDLLAMLRVQVRELERELE